MNTLYAKLAALLAAAFLAIGGVLVVVTQAMLEPERLLELSTDVVVGAVAFALLVALCVFQLFTRRLKRLADAVETFQREAFVSPLRVPGANPGGDEIDRLAAHVEQMSARIVAQLAELEQGVARRRELLANVSHDLRTPLASIQGYLEMLLLRRGSMEPAEERNCIETALRQSERLTRLVADLFELSKLEANELQPQAEAFPLAELAQDVAQKFALDAQRRQVTLSARCAPALPMVRADIGMIERVLENLVDNALRHTPAGGQVTIELDRDPKAGADTPRAGMAVQDTGPGISPEDLAAIFERYYRADRTRSRDHAGLGLAIAQRIVKLHGGELVVHSTPGQGTRFGFDLPFAAPARAAGPGAA
jgi:signal transduction histidine kinase